MLQFSKLLYTDSEDLKQTELWDIIGIKGYIYSVFKGQPNGGISLDRMISKNGSGCAVRMILALLT